MRAYARRQIATSDVVAPQPLQAEMRELAFIANGGLDIDNFKDQVLNAAKWLNDTFNQIKRTRTTTARTQTLNSGSALGQWQDVPNDAGTGGLEVDITTQDCFLQIETNVKWTQQYTLLPGQEPGRSLHLGVFVDGGLVALSPPSGTTGSSAAPGLGYAHAYLNCQVPVGPGPHVVKVRWAYLWNGALTVDMNFYFQARQVWVREARR